MKMAVIVYATKIPIYMKRKCLYPDERGIGMF